MEYISRGAEDGKIEKKLPHLSGGSEWE